MVQLPTLGTPGVSTAAFTGATGLVHGNVAMSVPVSQPTTSLFSPAKPLGHGASFVAPTSALGGGGVTGAVAGATAQPRSATAPAANAATGAASLFRVATFNVENFFSTQGMASYKTPRPSQADYQTKLTKLSLAITGTMGSPDVVALEEVGGPQALSDLLNQPKMKADGYKSVILPANNDNRGIHVAMIYRPTVTVTSATNSNPVSKLKDWPTDETDRSKLFARPPLEVQIDWKGTGAGQAAKGVGMTVIVNHLKSKLGGSRYAHRRADEGTYVGSLVDKAEAANPDRPVIVMGDLNAGYDDAAYKNILNKPDGSARLWDTSTSLPESGRYTYIYRGEKDQLDHVLTSANLKTAFKSTTIPHFDSGKENPHQASNPKVPNGVSDHDPIVVNFDMSKFKAGTPDKL